MTTHDERIQQLHDHVQEQQAAGQFHPFHPFANLFPMLSNEELLRLAENIQENGLFEKIVLWNGSILDGRNRFLACLLAEQLFPDFSLPQRFEQASFQNEQEALAWVISKNFHRRHLNASQRSIVAAELANLRHGQRADSQTETTPITQEQAAEMLNVSRRQVQTAKKVQSDAAPALVEAVRQGDISVSTAATLSQLPTEKQKELAEQSPQEMKAKAKELNEEKKAERQRKKEEKAWKEQERTRQEAAQNAPIELQFREANEDDLPHLIALLADDKLGRQREDLSTPPHPAYVEAFQEIDLDPNNELVLAEAEGRLVGMLQLTFIPSLTHLGAWRCQVEGVRIHSDFRRQGLGTQLLSWSIQRAQQRHCQQIQLTTDKQRPEAIQFYQSLGFRTTHEGLKMKLPTSDSFPSETHVESTSTSPHDPSHTAETPLQENSSSA